MANKKRSHSSSRWLQEHQNCPFVKEAKRLGYVSRAAFKLLEIQQKDKLLTKGMTVFDLGAAPGGWSQVVTEILQGKGRIIALDLLPLTVTLPCVDFIQGDFTTDDILQKIEKRLGPYPADIILSDLAPNLSGVAVTDQARMFYLAELVLAFALDHLKPGGNLLVKVFQGAGFQEFMQACREHFQKVVVRKPKASRERSKELYVLARDLGTCTT